MIDNADWPPPYSIKKYKNAKGVKFRVSPKHGLVITIPQRYKVTLLPALLDEYKSWIKEKMDAFYTQNQAKDVLPEIINFEASQQTWKVIYEHCDKPIKLLERYGNELVVIGRTLDKKIVKNKLITWVKIKSKIYLAEQLTLISQVTDLTFQDLTIRNQQTVWGSCTAKKNISLNYKLIFLPYALMKYVLIHELCHTRHLNHSIKFWKLVESFDPHWRQHRKSLRDIKQHLPTWT